MEAFATDPIVADTFKNVVLGQDYGESWGSSILPMHNNWLIKSFRSAEVLYSYSL